MLDCQVSVHHLGTSLVSHSNDKCITKKQAMGGPSLTFFPFSLTDTDAKKGAVKKVQEKKERHQAKKT